VIFALALYRVGRRGVPIRFPRTIPAAALCVAVLAASLGLSASVAQGATPRGALRQLPGSSGCLVDASSPVHGCAPARALAGPASFTGSNAVATSDDGRNVYVASSTSNAVAVLHRSPVTGQLTQPSGPAGCIAAATKSGCAHGAALRKPTSVAVSPDGRNVYVAAMRGSAVVVLSRRAGALRQVGCVAGIPIPGCATGTALTGADVVAVSPDGANVYVGAFIDNAVAVFARDSSTGALSPAGCIAQAVSGCAPAVGLGGPEGLAISPDGHNVYVGAAISGSIAVLNRDSTTGALTQPPAPGGCFATGTVSGCGSAKALTGADAIAVSPDGASVYVASGLANGFAAFARDGDSGLLTPLAGTAGCFLQAIAEGCGLGRAFIDPEGVAVSPDGASVYVGAFGSSAVDTFDRDTQTGVLTQKARAPGCIVAKPLPGCRTGRALGAANAIAVSPDGANVYVGAFRSNALDSFERAGRRPTKPGRG
jgi:DNA-binding beta-propeller fold protein YncE